MNGVYYACTISIRLALPWINSNSKIIYLALLAILIIFLVNVIAASKYVVNAIVHSIYHLLANRI